MMTIEVIMMIVMTTVGAIIRENLQENAHVIVPMRTIREVMNDIILPMTVIIILLHQCNEMIILLIHMVPMQAGMITIPIHLRITTILLLPPILL